MNRKNIERFYLKYLVIPRTPKILKGKIHIACIGDSITYGAGVNGKKEQTWEHFLNESLGEEYQVLNYGISGRTLQEEGDYPYKADKFYPISLDSRAQIYLIMLGTNDAKPYNWNAERFDREYDALIEEYIALPQHPQVILMSPPSCFPQASTGQIAFDIDGKTVDQIAMMTKEKAKKNKLPLIDLHEYTKAREEWFADGVHPNLEGNKAIAWYIWEKLSSGQNFLSVGEKGNKNAV